MLVENPIGVIIMENGERIIFRLYPKQAPNTVNSFIYLANSGLFNNREIKRIVKDFVIQPSYSNFDDSRCDFSLDGEFRENGFENNIDFGKWTLAMGGDGKAIASGSSFFITIGNNEERLDGKYAAFGKVIDGYDELMRIANVKTVSVDSGVPGVEINKPVVPEILKTVWVETFGIEYPEPIKLEEKK